jgi:RHS repeat-associated protein
MNRLVTGKCNTCGSGVTATGFNYVYDRFGNRLQETVTGTGTQPSYSFDANNHITSSSGVVYDAAGHVTNDGLGTSYTYDAEDRITSVSGANSATYVYDAEGHRVRATVNGQIRDFIFDLSGRTIAQLTAGAWTRSEVYAGGMHVASFTSSATEFDYSDWLGTFRMRSDISGNWLETCTSMPFGEDLACTGAADVTPIHFTGKERDSESGLDNFGARYNASSMGRFMTPDWAAKPTTVPYAQFGDPQSLNLYSYVRNNPLSSTDPDGHEVNLNGTDKQKAEEERRLAANATKTDKNGVKESSLFKNVTDKNGKTTMVLDKTVAANYQGGHSQGFKDIVQTINNKDVVSVNLVSSDDNTTHNDGGGHFTVNLATNQTALDRIAPLRNGNSLEIIAGHEILGHARMGMLGIPDADRDGPGSPVFRYENNVLRPEYQQAHPNGPIMGPRLDDEP